MPNFPLEPNGSLSGNIPYLVGCVPSCGMFQVQELAPSTLLLGERNKEQCSNDVSTEGRGVHSNADVVREVAQICKKGRIIFEEVR